ncbi:MAG: hypothetical protein FJX42_12645, partial [Alphaproteobacteria bacterium]|nr:hypothetical protein [Alphaproteobacteria bacterium]
MSVIDNRLWGSKNGAGSALGDPKKSADFEPAHEKSLVGIPYFSNPYFGVADAHSRFRRSRGQNDTPGPARKIAPDFGDAETFAPGQGANRARLAPTDFEACKSGASEQARKPGQDPAVGRKAVPARHQGPPGIVPAH